MTPDNFDLKIMQLLAQDGRLTNQQLGELIGLSASQCSRRRISLEQHGLITGYQATLAPNAMGTEVMCMIEVSLSKHDSETDQQFIKLIQTAPEIIDAVKTTGSYDYMLKVIVGDLDALSHFIGHVLPTCQNIAQVRTSVVLSRLKERGINKQIQ